MPINVNCQHFKDGGHCTHHAAPRKLWGLPRCVLMHPHSDARLVGSCRLVWPHQKPDGYPLPPPGVIQRQGSARAYTVSPVQAVAHPQRWSLEEVLAHRTGVVSPYYLHHVSPHGNAPPGSAVFVDRISKAFTEARVLAGLPDEGAATFHELRSLSKRLYEKQGGVDTKALLGHASDKTAALYADARGVEAVVVKVA